MPHKMPTVLFGIFLILGLILPLGEASAATEELPGLLFGTGTSFTMTTSPYLNITLASSVPITARITSLPKTISLAIEAAAGANSTDLVLGGLTPSTTYYKYIDDLHQSSPFMADGEGKHTCTLDLSTRRVVFIQNRPSTLFINLSGWSNPAVGTWDPITFTATLVTDVAGDDYRSMPMG